MKKKNRNRYFQKSLLNRLSIVHGGKSLTIIIILTLQFWHINFILQKIMTS